MNNIRREAGKIFQFQQSQCGRCNGRGWLLRVRQTATGKDRRITDCPKCRGSHQ